MGNRTGAKPDASHSMIERLSHATDLKLPELAKTLGVPLSELEKANDPRMFLIEWQKDDMWWKIQDYVNETLGHLLALNADLQQKLQSDRVRQAGRLALARAREKRSSPRR